MTSTNHDIDISRYHHSVSVALVYLRGCFCCFCRPTRPPPVQPEGLQYSVRPPLAGGVWVHTVEKDHVGVLRSGENHMMCNTQWRKSKTDTSAARGPAELWAEHSFVPIRRSSDWSEYSVSLSSVSNCSHSGRSFAC